jgi:hypothetical protein
VSDISFIFQGHHKLLVKDAKRVKDFDGVSVLSVVSDLDFSTCTKQGWVRRHGLTFSDMGRLKGS